MDALWGCQGVYMGRFPEFWTPCRRCAAPSTKTLCWPDVCICAVYMDSMQKNAAHKHMRLGHTDFVEKCRTNVKKPHDFG